MHLSQAIELCELKEVGHRERERERETLFLPIQLVPWIRRLASFSGQTFCLQESEKFAGG